MQVTSGNLGNLVVRDLLGSFFIDRFIKSIIPSERKIVPFSSSPVRVVMVQETKTYKTEERNDDIIANKIAGQEFR